MDADRNPFSPGAGTPPPELAGRDHILRQADLTFARIIAGRYEQSQLLVGLRGVGKTVVLNKVREKAESLGYGVAMVEATEAKTLPALLVPALRKILIQLDSGANISAKAKKAMRVLKSFVGAVRVTVNDMEFGISVDPETGAADSGDLETDLGDLFIAVGEAAKDRDTLVAIIIDEMQYLNEKEMSALIMAFHRIAQHQLPVVLIGAGLPQLVALAGRSKSYAERLFTYPAIGALSNPDAREAIVTPAGAQQVFFTDEAIAALIEKTQGYPYFLQEWGYAAWNLATVSPISKDVIDRATHDVITKLDGSFFRVRFDRLTPRERDYVRALGALGSGVQRSGDVADLLGVKVQTMAPIRSSLIKKGMIFSPAHGDTAFTVPLFDEYICRTMPDWHPA